MADKKKNNHYVPKLYLKSFKDGSGVLHTFDKKTSKTYELKNLDNTAKSKNLYTIKNKISLIDALYTKQISRLAFDDVDEKALLWYVCFLNDDLANLFSITLPKELQNTNTDDVANKWIKEADAVIKNKINSESVSRNQEELFYEYENDFEQARKTVIKNGLYGLYRSKDELFTLYMYLKMFKITHIALSNRMFNMVKTFKDNNNSLSEDISDAGKELNKVKNALKNDNAMVSRPYFDILHYMFMQHFRTPRHCRDLFDVNMADLMKRVSGININNVICLINHFIYIKYIEQLHICGYKLILIENKSGVDFITSDNPSVFINDNLIRSYSDPNNFEMYFPLSPKYGLLYSGRPCYEHISKIIYKQASDIIPWNNLIKENATRYIYANNATLLAN